MILDFNRAINYPSAFTPYGTCPMPVKNNSLDYRIEAGEKSPPSSEAGSFSPASISQSRLLFRTGMGQVPYGVKALG